MSEPTQLTLFYYPRKIGDVVILLVKITFKHSIPAINIESSIVISSNFPDSTANSAIPRASPPAEIVPKERLNPLLKVAPKPKIAKA